MYKRKKFKIRPIPLTGNFLLMKGLYELSIALADTKHATKTIFEKSDSNLGQFA